MVLSEPKGNIEVLEVSRGRIHVFSSHCLPSPNLSESDLGDFPLLFDRCIYSPNGPGGVCLYVCSFSPIFLWLLAVTLNQLQK